MRYFLFSLVVITLFFVACQPPPKEQELKINIADEPTTLNPGKARTLQEMTLMKALFEGLTRINREEKAELALAEKVELSEDLKTYTFYLRPSKWTNGNALTAEDFVYAWKRILHPEFLADQAFQLYPIKNAKEIKKGELPIDELGVKALDHLTLQVELEEPTAYFLNLTALPVFFPVNSMIDKTDALWSKEVNTYVCNGPFLLEKWEHHDCIVLRKNPSYWDAKHVKLSSIEMPMISENGTEFQMFEKKELDWAGSPLSMLPLDTLPRLKDKNLLETKPLLGTFFIRINSKKAPLHEVDFRRALSLSINRKEIMDHVTSGTQIPATGLVPFSMGLQKNPYFIDGNINSGPFQLGDFDSITMIYPAKERNHQIAQAIQQQWMKAFGLQIKLEALEAKVYYARVAKQDYQLAIGSWTADFDDPINFLEIFKYRAEKSNNTDWENNKYIQLLDKVKKVKDFEERKELLRQSEEILISEMPIIPIFHYNMLYLKNEQLKEVVLSTMGTLDFKWAYFEVEK